MLCKYLFASLVALTGLTAMRPLSVLAYSRKAAKDPGSHGHDIEI